MHPCPSPAHTQTPTHPPPPTHTNTHGTQHTNTYTHTSPHNMDTFGKEGARVDMSRQVRSSVLAYYLQPLFQHTDRVPGAKCHVGLVPRDNVLHSYIHRVAGEWILHSSSIRLIHPLVEIFRFEPKKNFQKRRSSKCLTWIKIKLIKRKTLIILIDFIFLLIISNLLKLTS